MWFYVAALLGFYYLFRWYREKQIFPNLTEKYVFITGCDSGFGNLLAQQLDAKGLRVLAGCLTQQGAEKLKEATSERLQTILIDVNSTENLDKVTEWVKSQVGDKGLWGLVNNAGISIPTAPNEWLTKEDFKKIIDINLLGLIDVTLHMIPLLRKAKGRIVNIASVMGRLSIFGEATVLQNMGWNLSLIVSAQNLTRTDLVNIWMETYQEIPERLELSPFGVKVCIIEPGYFRTAITNMKILQENFRKIWEHLPEETKEVYGESYYNSMIEETSKLQAHCNPKLHLVTNCMEHALTAVHPRFRYSAGWDAKLFYLPISYLPTKLTDMLLLWSYPQPKGSL